ncbi:MAG: amidohydrolase family protein [Bacteriovoracaceae bacterium]|nr:guanine deaminase [Halobacteriovoraceae bacterium]MDP7322082.1 amidohydrolase family protein [Bacteriovoracaceae bacterium]
MNSSTIVVLAHIINPQSDKKCDFIKNGALLLKKNRTKKNYFIQEIGPQKKVLAKVIDECQVIDYSDHVIIPSFFDMHFHWVQDDVRQMPKADLLHWLENYTFPAETKFANKAYTKKKAKVFFKRLVQTGTLGGACYSSIHPHATEEAFEHAVGDFVIGNVLMTMNSPKSLTQTKKEALDSVKFLAKKYKQNYALTPRFAIATDPQTMLATGAIAKKNKSFIQSHLSETQGEISFVTNLYKELEGFEKIKSYTEIYKKVGLLTPKTIMGHGIHLSVEELQLLKGTQTAIAHCPTSNAPIRQKGLGSGLFNFKKIERYGLRWALGSDIGGGPFLSMFDVMRSFVEQNKKAGVSGANYKKALYRATLAGAEILQKDKKLGNLNPLKEANFLVLPKINSQLKMNPESILEFYVKKGQKNRAKFDDLVEKVFYQGKLIYNKRA